MSEDEPLIYPGDIERDEPIERRSDDEIVRELAVDESSRLQPGDAPGGAEGGDESRSADVAIDVPSDEDPLGDTDQHSDADNLPRHREQRNREPG